MHIRDGVTFIIGELGSFNDYLATRDLTCLISERCCAGSKVQVVWFRSGRFRLLFES